MKKNCQILTVEELAHEAAIHIKRIEGKNMSYKWDSCTLSKEGDLTLVCCNEETLCYDLERTFTGNELAHMLNMPLWEVVMIDNGGSDDNALFLYEQE